LEQYVELNMNKIVIKFVLGSVVTQTVLDGPTIHHPAVQVSYSVYVPTIMKIG